MSNDYMHSAAELCRLEITIRKC